MGTNEISNIDVTKMLIKQMGMSDREDVLISYVPDRCFNDLRYTINSDKLAKLGWQELITWEQGIAATVQWYKTNSDRFGDIEQSLVAHPRVGLHDKTVAEPNL